MDCSSSYLVLPYFCHPTRAVKSDINRSFLQRLKRAYGKKKRTDDMAYMHCLEEQGGQLHVNYLLLHQKEIDPEEVCEMWRKSLPPAVQGEYKRSKCYCAPCQDEERVGFYMTKANAKEDPREYLPPKGCYKKTMYYSRNWRKFMEEHLMRYDPNEVLGFEWTRCDSV